MDKPAISERLRAGLGRPRPVERLASSPRSRVWLVEFDGAPAIVKQVVGGADAAERFSREITALGLAGRARPPVVPAVLAVEPDDRVMVLERLPSAAPAEDWVVDYARALARLHATTTAEDRGVLPGQQSPSLEDVDSFLALARYLRVLIPPRAVEQLVGLCDRLAEPRGHALLHGDPCPGNDLHSADGVRFVDLEHAALGDGLTELAYLRIGFPTCWCVTDVAPGLRAEAEQAYVEHWRSATGTDPAGSLADACAGWLVQGDALVERARRRTVDHLARVVDEDWTWGTTTARGRLAFRTAVVAEVAGEDTALADVGRLCRDVHARITAQWPRTQAPLSARRTHAS